MKNTKRITVSTQVVYARPTVMQSSQLAGLFAKKQISPQMLTRCLRSGVGEGDNFQIWICGPEFSLPLTAPSHGGLRQCGDHIVFQKVTVSLTKHCYTGCLDICDNTEKSFICLNVIKPTAAERVNTNLTFGCALNKVS